MKRRKYNTFHGSEIRLGILSFGPKSGYEVRKIIDKSVGFFWQESYGQIYPILERLLQEKSVKVTEVRQKSRPDKKVYAVTKTGMDKLKSWMLKDAEKQPLRDELLLKLFFGSRTDRKNLIRILSCERSESRSRLKIFQSIKKEVESCRDQNKEFSLYTLDYGIEYMKMHAKWCERTIREIEKEKNSKTR